MPVILVRNVIYVINVIIYLKHHQYNGDVLCSLAAKRG